MQHCRTACPATRLGMRRSPPLHPRVGRGWPLLLTVVSFGLIIFDAEKDIEDLEVGDMKKNFRPFDLPPTVRQEILNSCRTFGGRSLMSDGPTGDVRCGVRLQKELYIFCHYLYS